jgi:hypothetical protein
LQKICADLGTLVFFFLSMRKEKRRPPREIGALLAKGQLEAGDSKPKSALDTPLSGHKSSVGIVVDVLGEPYVKLNYTITDRDSGEKTDCDYKIGLTTTPYHFGGVRYWFICPLSRNGVPCGRRVGIVRQ